MASIVKSSIEYFADPTKGRPVANGYVYVGTIDLDPEVPANQKQISVIQEDGTTVEVAQPLSLSAGGVPVYSGSPVTIVVDGDYSLKVNDKHGAQVYYIAHVHPSVTTSEVVMKFDTIADLRASDIYTSINKVKVLGYSAVGDSGGGPLRTWNSGSGQIDTGGDIIVPGGSVGSVSTVGAWIFEKGIEVSFKYFGAVGDDTADDTIPVQNTFDYVKNGGGIRVEKGMFKVTTITLNDHKGINIRSVGHRNDTHGLHITGVIDCTNCGVNVIENVNFISSGNTNNCFNFNADCAQWKITGCSFLGFDRALNFTDNNYIIDINHNVFSNNNMDIYVYLNIHMNIIGNTFSEWKNVSILLVNFKNVTIDANQFESIVSLTGYSVEIGSGAAVDGKSSVTNNKMFQCPGVKLNSILNMNIMGNDIYTIQSQHPIHQVSGDRININDNIIEYGNADTSKSCIYISGTGKSSVNGNDTIAGAAHSSIRIDASTDSIVKNNRLENGINGIYLESLATADRHIIKDNIITSTTGSGIKDVSCVDAAANVEGNIITTSGTAYDNSGGLNMQDHNMISIASQGTSLAASTLDVLSLGSASNAEDLVRTSGTTITIKSKGWYLINCAVSISAMVTGDAYYQVRVGGGDVKTVFLNQKGGSTANYYSNDTHRLHFDSDDVIDFSGYQTDTVSRTMALQVEMVKN